MAGKNISAYLSARDYDHFYELFHAVSEVILSSCANVKGYCHVIQQLSAQDPEIFPDADALADLQAFTEFATEFGASMRRFFWPPISEDTHQNSIPSMERWQPYDPAAWDSMLAQMIAALHPLVQSARDHYERMISYPPGQSQHAEKVQEILLAIGRHLNVLSRRCNPEEIETLLFRSSKDDGGLSPPGNI
jgi:hypothetical protein